MNSRTKARQNLLVASVNTALERGLITLECEPVTSTKFEFNIGPHPVIAYVSDAGFDEVSIHATVNPTELGRRMVSCAVWHGWRRFGEATTFAWLERHSGKYLQSGVEYHGTKAITAYLGTLTITPLGFDTKPTKTGYDFHKEYESVFGPSLDRARLSESRLSSTAAASILHTPISFDTLRATFEPMELCSNGFTNDAQKRAASWETRADLKQHLVQEVEGAIEWLKLCEQTETVSRRSTSYGLKHEAERWCREQGRPNGGYISNGALLMAAYALGFTVYRPTKRPDFPNAFLNISQHRPQAKENR
jgi:hypothetical protein